MHQRPARIGDIRNIAVPLIRSGAQQRLPELTKNSCRILEVKQNRSDAVGTHWAYAMGEDKPPSLGFDGRTTVPELQCFPCSDRLLAGNRVGPLEWMIRVGNRIRFTVGS